MPISPYFSSAQHSNATQEQFLLEDLINEFIKIYGVDVYILPRESQQEDIDWVYGEDPLKRFDKSFAVEMYLKEASSYSGQGDFFSKFGLELRDDTTLVVARRAFMRYVPNQFNRSGGGPREGDLIWFPLTHSLFEIRNVEEETEFFTFGRRKPYFYELRCERFKYGDEIFTTGQPEVDNEILTYTYTITLALSSANGNGKYYSGETVFQGTDLANSTASAIVVAFDYPAMTLNVAHIRGTFASSTPIWGANSNAHYTYVTSDDISDIRIDDIVDNKRIEVEANKLVDFSEDNPFGNL